MLMGVELVDFVSDWSKCMNMYVRTGVCRLSATAIFSVEHERSKHD